MIGKRAVSSYSLFFLQLFQLQNVGHIWSVMVMLANIIFWCNALYFGVIVQAK